jgi:hypothetical protein
MWHEKRLSKLHSCPVSHCLLFCVFTIHSVITWMTSFLSRYKLYHSSPSLHTSTKQTYLIQCQGGDLSMHLHTPNMLHIQTFSLSHPLNTHRYEQLMQPGTQQSGLLSHRLYAQRLAGYSGLHWCTLLINWLNSCCCVTCSLGTLWRCCYVQFITCVFRERFSVSYIELKDNKCSEHILWDTSAGYLWSGLPQN